MREAILGLQQTCSLQVALRPFARFRHHAEHVHRQAVDHTGAGDVAAGVGRHRVAGGVHAHHPRMLVPGQPGHQAALAVITGFGGLEIVSGGSHVAGTGGSAGMFQAGVQKIRQITQMSATLCAGGDQQQHQERKGFHGHSLAAPMAAR